MREKNCCHLSKILHNMDFTRFIELKDQIEPGTKTGLYAVMQSHLPPEYSYFRAGLAGKPVDSATQFKSAEGTFASRFATYLNYWGPSGARVYAVLTVPRRSILGFAERVMPLTDERDGREPYARMHLGNTLIQIREKEYHRNLSRLGAVRWRMPTTQEGRERSEFFKTDVQTCIRALREIGTGDLYVFGGNDPSQITKTTLRRRGIDEIVPEHVALRQSERLHQQPPQDDDDDDFEETTVTREEVEEFERAQRAANQPPTFRVSAGPSVINQLASGNVAVASAVGQLANIRRSPRLAGETPVTPVELQLSASQIQRLEQGSPRMQRGMQALRQLRRSPRLAET